MEQLGNLAGKCGIYKFTFSNGHYYIGQAINLRRRELQHLRDMGKQKHTNKRVQNCFNKYGAPFFEVICECSREDIDKKETEFIYTYIDDENCCNICREGRSRKGTTQSESAKKTISDYQYLTGKNKPVYMFSRDNNFLLGKFRSIRDAEKAINCNPKDVQKSCKSNGYYNVQKYKFRYAVHVDPFIDRLKQIVKL